MWEKELDIASRAAKEAGAFLRGTFGKLIRVDKKGRIDLVSEADIESERIILGFLRESFPQDEVLTEEAGLSGPKASRIWMVDPLDGTVNYVHGFPFYAVSIALREGDETVVGVVYDPFSNEFFEAVKGEGAFLNKGPIRVTSTAGLQEALLATGFPYSIREKFQPVMKRFAKMVYNAQGVRRPGSAALDLCYVAAGRLDGFWEEGLKPWDTAAGALIVTEAGGIISCFDGSRHSPYSADIIASNPLIYRYLVSLIAE
ncbi:MAG: inositol monophosphatase [Deltaproteobacteria bacterium CG23_combo_of_CG06-09_8_20_14_all_51_20]|nr:MAG: inositol monophosphatase [Deltaproteobacteria bacterium CG23_combo_of_CG06-09_8_20_14_all_51_20]PJB37342.1 MAG: inositol monophosphatase [Deltaproteobacteria bacterium CG_4_9_14_3_um_filter_51_14]